MSSLLVPRRRETIIFRDAPIIYKNFTGVKKQFNPEGSRNFSIMMAEDQALELQRDGWNVKQMKPREEDTERLYHMKVKVAFGNRPPQVWLISSGGRTMLGESLVGMFDQLDFSRIDLVVAAYDWEMNGNSGRSAYLQTMFGTMYEDELMLEYAHVPQLPSAGDAKQQELEPGARMAYDYDGEIVPDEDDRTGIPL